MLHLPCNDFVLYFPPVSRSGAKLVDLFQDIRQVMFSDFVSEMDLRVR